MSEFVMATSGGNSNNPLILAIETSGRLGSVALAQGGKLLSETCFSGPMRHSAEIFPAIINLLSRYDKKPDQIEQIQISVGPGSFTGLRIAVTLAKTMALANGAQIVAVDTLDVIAANVINFTAEHAENAEKEINKNNLCGLSGEISRLAVVLDAKRGQFFIAVYEKTTLKPPTTTFEGRQAQGGQEASWKKTLPDCLMTAEEFLARFTDKTIMLTGEGLVFYKDKFASPNVSVFDEKFWNPSAANVHKLGWNKAQLGEFADPLTLIPNYIRGPDAIVKQR